MNYSLQIRWWEGCSAAVSHHVGKYVTMQRSRRVRNRFCAGFFYFGKGGGGDVDRPYSLSFSLNEKSNYRHFGWMSLANSGGNYRKRSAWIKFGENWRKFRQISLKSFDGRLCSPMYQYYWALQWHGWWRAHIVRLWTQTAASFYAIILILSH